MDLGGTGAQLVALTTGNNDVPALTQGVPTQFFCNTIPDRCPTFRAAYYLPVLFLTIFATLNQPATSGSAIPWDLMPGLLIESVDWINAWHGTPVSANHVKGVHLPLVEYHTNGFRYATRRRPPYPATVGAYPVELTVAITPSISRKGRLMGDTSQLAMLFQQSSVKINVASAAALTSVSTGATFTAMTARLSAALVPRNELVLGTPVETILHQIVAGSNANLIQIKGFGTDTMLKGIESKGGVAYLAELTSINRQGGAFLNENVTQFSFPWRGQDQIQDMWGYGAMCDLGNMPNDRANTFPSIVVGGDSEFNNPPYAMDKSDQNTTTSTNMDLTKKLAFNLGVQGGNDLVLSDIQTADADKQYYLTVSGGFTGNTHMILAMYARQWLETMRMDWVKRVTDGEDSLAEYVLGSRSAARTAKLLQRPPLSKHYLSTDNLAYLPWVLTPAAAAGAAG